MTYELQDIPLSDLKVQKHNVRRHGIDLGLDEMVINIKANGLLQPITVYLDTEKDPQIFVVLAGQRRLNAYQQLNEKYPSQGYDKIKCIVMDEPDSLEKKIALSLAENITQLPMTENDLVKAVTDLYNKYNDYDMVAEEFGLSEYMVDKYVKLARLPDVVKDAISNGEIHTNPKSAENNALKAAEALGYKKGGDVPVENVVELAKQLTGDMQSADIKKSAAKEGGDVSKIVENLKRKKKETVDVSLSTEISEKLTKVSQASGETRKSKATKYVTEGVEKDYDEIDE